MSSRAKRELKENKLDKNTVIGIVAVAIILIYIAFNAVPYFMKNGINLCEVVSGSSAGSYETQYTALALREEKTVNAASGGYISFFAGESTRVYVGEQTYLIDETGEITEALKGASENADILSESDLTEIKAQMLDFDMSYDPYNYRSVASFKSKIVSQISDYVNNSVFGELSGEISGISADSYAVYTTDTSGVILHFTDGFEGITEADVDASSFRRENYEKKSTNTGDLVEEGSAIYKLITSQKWQLVIQIDDASAFSELEQIEIEFVKDKITATADISTFTRSGVNYAVLSLGKYMIRYAQDRYINIKLKGDEEEGLKVPKSAVSQKQFFTIPKAYLTESEQSDSEGFLKQTTDDAGNVITTFVSPPIYGQDDEYCYISVDSLNSGDILLLPEGVEATDSIPAEYTVNAKENRDGVYVYSDGAYTFTLINILGENGTYYIAESGDTYSIRIYDQIVENASDYEE